MSWVRVEPEFSNVTHGSILRGPVSGLEWVVSGLIGIDRVNALILSRTVHITDPAGWEFFSSEVEAWYPVSASNKGMGRLCMGTKVKNREMNPSIDYAVTTYLGDGGVIASASMSITSSQDWVVRKPSSSGVDLDDGQAVPAWRGAHEGVFMDAMAYTQLQSIFEALRREPGQWWTVRRLCEKLAIHNEGRIDAAVRHKLFPPGVEYIEKAGAIWIRYKDPFPELDDAMEVDS